MTWLRWVVVALAVWEAGFMAFDGTRALVTGDYITPGSGEHAGQLGPWTKLVEVVGIQPRSTLMKTIFVVFGGAWLLVTAAFAAKQGWAWVLMLLFSLGSLWYLIIGTVTSAAIIVLLLLPAVREMYLA